MLYNLLNIYYHSFNHRDNIVTKNRSLMPLDLNIILGPYNFILQATVDIHERACTVVIILLLSFAVEIIYWYDYRPYYACNRFFPQLSVLMISPSVIGLRNAISITHPTLQVYIILYILIVECLWSDRGGWEFINSHGAGTFVCPIKYRSRNR